MTEYIYYWYHHMMPDKERKVIERVLAEKDYNSFIDLYKKYSIKAIELGFYDERFKCWTPMIYLPTEIVAYNENNDIIENQYLSVLNQEDFYKITYAECECG